MSASIVWTRLAQMESLPTSTDVIIAGGGMTGLAAAIYLGRGGKAVILFTTRGGG